MITAKAKSLPPKLYDMHVHTVHSDGRWSPMQLAEMARRTGLAGIFFTDHDTIISPAALAVASRGFGVELFPGVELSTEYGGRGLHLLGYSFDADHEGLLSLCRRLQCQRRQRWWQMVEILRDRKIRFDEPRLARIASLSTPGRLHLARELVHLRAARSIRGAFSQHLSGLEIQVRAAAPIEEAIDTLHAAGGIAVLAHPPALLTKETWTGLAERGLDGIEIGHPSIRGTHRRFLQTVAEQHQFLTTAGSDYHGDEPTEGLGSYTMTERQLEAIVRRDSLSLPALAQ